MSEFPTLEKCKKLNPDGVFVQVASGRYIDLKSPKPVDIDIDDIAQGLSNLCRFNGQCRHFYSVAQHSVFVSKLVPPEFALAGLLHDGSEAYVGDVVSPLKTLIPKYQSIENRFRLAIRTKYRLPLGAIDHVQKQDMIAMATEVKHLMPAEHISEWQIDRVEPYETKIEPLLPAQAKRLFMSRYHEIIAELGLPNESIDNFNQQFPVGTEVLFEQDGLPIPTKITSEAFTTSAGRPLVMLEGVKSGVCIQLVKAVAA